MLLGAGSNAKSDVHCSSVPGYQSAGPNGTIKYQMGVLSYSQVNFREKNILMLQFGHE